jgi:hypothetical protein
MSTETNACLEEVCVTLNLLWAFGHGIGTLGDLKSLHGV